jgi:hypothetical protein
LPFLWPFFGSAFSLLAWPFLTGLEDGAPGLAGEVWRWLLGDDLGVMERLDLGIGREGNGERRGTC